MTKKSTTYYMCSLQKGSSHTTAWLPAKFAVEGKYLKLKDHRDIFENGWLVISVSKDVAREIEDILAQDNGRKSLTSIL